MILGVFIALCIGALIASTFIVLGVRRWALRHLMDVPNERSSHKIPTPRGGGLGIAAASLIFWIAAYLLNVVNAGAFTTGVLVLMIGAGLIAALGWIDDRNDLAAKVRLLLQLSIAAAAVLLIGAVTAVELPGLGIIRFAPLIAIGLNIIWVVGFTNIYNFMDGIDGLAGSQALIAGIGWCMLFLGIGMPDLALFGALIAASSLGFLFLNRPRALIFMGDIGSTFLGFSLAVVPLVAFARTSDTRLLGTAALFVAPFALDGTFTIIRRAIRRENILKAHRSHIYQRLATGNVTHLQVTGLYVIFAFVSVICGLIYYTSADRTEGLLAVLTPIIIFFGLAIWTTRREITKKQFTSVGTMG